MEEPNAAADSVLPSTSSPPPRHETPIYTDGIRSSPTASSTAAVPAQIDTLGAFILDKEAPSLSVGEDGVRHDFHYVRLPNHGDAVTHIAIDASYSFPNSLSPARSLARSAPFRPSHVCYARTDIYSGKPKNRSAGPWSSWCISPAKPTRPPPVVG